MPFVMVISCENRLEQSEQASLPIPDLTLCSQTGTSFSIIWNPVENASGYTYEFQGEVRSITENTLTFENLEHGSYTVSVRADAPRHSSDWKSSEFAQITINMDGIVVSVKANDISWNSVMISCTPNTGLSYIYDIIAKDFYQTFYSDEEMVASYMEYVESSGVPVSMILKMGKDSTGLVGLSPDTEYIAFAVCMDDEGNILSDVFKTEFVTDVMPPVDPELEKWFGPWTATSEQVLRWTLSDDKQSFDNNVVNENKVFDIVITADPNNYEQALIEGWASCKKYPALARLGSDNSLQVYSGVVMDAADDRGLSPTWGTWSYIEYEDASENRYSLIKGQFPAYSFTMTGNKATSTLYSDYMSNVSKFTTVALDIFAIGDAGWTVYLDGNGNIPDMPAGNITLVKTESYTQSPFCILNNF